MPIMAHARACVMCNSLNASFLQDPVMGL